MTATSASSCPQCRTLLPSSIDQPVVTCEGCGLQLSTEYLAEAQRLYAWRDSVDARLAWLEERLLAGDLPGREGAVAAPAAEGPTSATAEPGTGSEAAPRRPATAGALLLAVGAFLLVAAGIAFIAFTWDLLGPLGQITVLLALGAGCLWTAHRLAVTLHGTAVAIGVVGALLVAIASLGARFLGPDLIGGLPSLVLAVVILIALTGASVVIRRRLAGVGELGGAVGATLSIALIAFAPGDDSIPLPDPWGWWSAVWLLGGAVALLVLADRLRLRAWPWVGTVLLVAGSLTLAGWVTDVLSRTTELDGDALVFGGVMALAALAVSVGLARLAHHDAAVLTAAAVVWWIAVVLTWTSAVDPGGPRGWSGLALLAVGAVAVVPALLGRNRRTLRALTTVAGGIVMASAVGVAAAPYVAARIDLDPQAWAAAAWPTWRGVVAGVAFVLVLALTLWLAPRAATRLDRPWLVPTLPLATTAGALATWLITAQVDIIAVTTPAGPYEYAPEATPETVVRQIGVTLVVVAIGVLGAALLRRLPAWSVWLEAALGIVAVLLASSTVTIESALAPELLGVGLAVPAIAASVGWWWLRRPQPSPTWQTLAPPFVLAALPSTLALLNDAGERWWSDLDPDPGPAYQVRTVALLVVAVVAALVGARQRWSGLFFPGLALALVVVAVELVDLGRFLPQWVSFALAGAALVAAGARWEWIRNRGREGAAWVRGMH